ncbi:hypothetical protein GGR34_000764 [Microvirga flocculans]|uniref:Uncharacterized protein n=1 Tax=Microvirga flocculans TaxID=217168 RepID=A0A7W6ICZ7_9HYPH|nr:hypothetical protein [Microvirga flocculans]
MSRVLLALHPLICVVAFLLGWHFGQPIREFFFHPPPPAPWSMPFCDIGGPYEYFFVPCNREEAI